MNSYQMLKDVTYTYNADIGLSYSTPCRGMWNIVHLAAQVPQSHQVYVCPTSCLRGVVLTTAEMGCMDRLSTITVGEDNILEGDLEETILYGVEKIIHTLPVKPKVIFIFTSCIHHFMAANYQRVYKILRDEFQDIDFVDAYMDPIMRRKTPPLPCLQRQVYRMLKETSLISNQVNFIDNWFAPVWNDLYDHLLKNHIVVKDFATEKEYDSYLQMNASRMNISFHKFGRLASNDMHYRLKQDSMIMRQTYDYDVIDEDMKTICEKLDIPEMCDEEIDQLLCKTERVISETKQLIKEMPVSIDASAIDEPLSLALFLSRHHFTVDSIYLSAFTESEEVFLALQKEAPDIRIYSAENWNMRVVDRHTPYPVLAIGQQAAYYNSTEHFVDVIVNAGMYGYRGIQHLMELMKDAYQHPKDIAENVQRKGWGCTAR